MWHRTENCNKFCVTKCASFAIIFWCLESYPSGSRGRTRNALGRVTGAWVRIPCSPRRKKSCREVFSTALFVSCIVSTSQSRTCRSLGGGSYRFACRKAYPGLVPLRRGERCMLPRCGLSAVLETAPQRARMKRTTERFRQERRARRKEHGRYRRDCRDV